MAGIPLTWLGHGAFRFDTTGGKRVYVDPFLDNPKCPDSEKEPERVDLIALTHAHDDHFGSTLDLAQKFGCHVAAPMVELGDWLVSREGLPEDRVTGWNKGGTVDVDGVKITATDARHSSSYDGEVEGKWAPIYMGEPAGLVFDVGGPRLYFAGDTCVFGDMQLIARLYEPDVAILPIGDHFTMGPKEAALALELLGVERCIPCHYGTFPLLTGTLDEFRGLAGDVEVLSPEPGETIEL